MANWTDYISLLLTIAGVAAIACCVVYMNAQVRRMAQAGREKLHNRGVEVSDHGISLKTRSRLTNRENYVDATQRGFIKALSASHTSHSTGTSPNMGYQGLSLENGNGNGVPGSLKRRDSGGSTRSDKSANGSGGGGLRAWAHRDRGRSDATI